MASSSSRSSRAKPLALWLASALVLACTSGCGSGGSSLDDAGSTDAMMTSRDGGGADQGSSNDQGGNADAGHDAGSSPGPATDPGAACSGNGDCSRDVCLGLPGGYCSSVCTDHSDCGEGNRCLTGYCYARCESHANCTRADYFCTTLDTYLDDEGFHQLWRACYIGQTLGGTADIADGLTVVVTDSVGGTLALTESGPFTFPSRVALSSNYAVTFEPQGDVQGVSCRGMGLTGRVVDDITSVFISCGRQAVFTDPGTHAWVVPAGVTAVSVVAVGSGGRGSGNRGGGGGELCYQNDIPVTPGETIDVVVGDLFSEAAGGHDSSFDGELVAHGGRDAFGSPDGWVVPGGMGGTVGTCFAGGSGSYNSSSGGAAGYAGVGGNARMGVPAQNGAGGGGAGGAFGTPGGGVGLEGMGANGIAEGGHGSQASPDVPVAGGGGTTYNNRPQNGQHGGVRIIWGTGRSYPSQAGNL
ncbi:MAG: hypothetical protein H6726_32580 [Sandaracinaceae bacterium]|nr:hypothetical protein [Sandaracinaceae bacterium]